MTGVTPSSVSNPGASRAIVAALGSMPKAMSALSVV
jgi:hypothetical protein